MPAMGMANQIVVEAPGWRVMTGSSRRMNTPTSRPTEPTAAAAMVARAGAERGTRHQGGDDRYELALLDVDALHVEGLHRP